ncbi:hypothetical protein GUJ93_ZPchr0009g2231 [Zizania palustris]|uniref:Uncharacterized protein n=1 Tax=Zizania palustris TaxID=103762 RepID=A0A8J5VNC2_ZIZPA|nr:hypothetical protein GUJ93_ZPchr0009g2231 [Zizania palustris]
MPASSAVVLCCPLLPLRLALPLRRPPQSRCLASATALYRPAPLPHALPAGVVRYAGPLSSCAVQCFPSVGCRGRIVCHRVISSRILRVCNNYYVSFETNASGCGGSGWREASLRVAGGCGRWGFRSGWRGALLWVRWLRTPDGESLRSRWWWGADRRGSTPGGGGSAPGGGGSALGGRGMRTTGAPL